MNVLRCLVFVMVLPVALCRSDDAQVAADSGDSPLDGVWATIEPETAEFLQLVFWDDNVCFYMQDSPVPMLPSSYSVNLETAPWSIDVNYNGTTVLGLVAVDDDVLSLTLANPDEARPHSLENSYLRKYRRVTPENPELVSLLNSLDADFRLDEAGRCVSINLGSTECSDETLEQLAEVDSLQKLFLVDTPITSEGLAHLADLELMELILIETKVDDSAIPLLSQMSSLKRMSVGGTALTIEGVNQLRAALPECEIAGHYPWRTDSTQWVVQECGEPAIAFDAPWALVEATTELPEVMVQATERINLYRYRGNGGLALHVLVSTFREDIAENPESEVDQAMNDLQSDPRLSDFVVNEPEQITRGEVDGIYGSATYNLNGRPFIIHHVCFVDGRHKWILNFTALDTDESSEIAGRIIESIEIETPNGMSDEE